MQDLDDLLSVQLYSLRALGELDAILAAVASAGYTQVELIGDQLMAPATTANSLAQAGLKASSSHIGLAELNNQLPAVIEASQALGVDRLYMPAVPEDQRQMPASGWRALGQQLAEQSERLAQHGIALGYHNHDWELALQDDGLTALDHLFDAAGPAPLTFEADLAWLQRGGADPYAWLTRYRDRIDAAHVKDLAGPDADPREEGWADVGHGIMDWPAYWPAALSAGATLMVVEHDQPLNPAQSIKRSRDYLKELLN